jgi:ferredoxin
MSARTLVVSVNLNLCIGNAMCREAARSTFVADESGLSVGVNPPPDTREDVFAAARACPVCAILVRDAESGEEIYE